MNQVNCPVCGKKCVKSGKTKAGSQRWLCKSCKTSLTHKIDTESKELQLFLNWLFSKDSQADMPGEGRTFRRKTAKFWDIWPLPPKVEEAKDVLFLDGTYLSSQQINIHAFRPRYIPSRKSTSFVSSTLGGSGQMFQNLAVFLRNVLPSPGITD